MNMAPARLKKILILASNLSIYHKLSLLIMAIMFFLALLVGWQSTNTIWKHSRKEQKALADNLLRLSLQKIHAEHTLMMQYKHLMITRKRKVLEESMNTLFPFFEGLDKQVREGKKTLEYAQSVSLEYLGNFPNTAEDLYYIFSENNSRIFLPPQTLSVKGLQQSKYFGGRNAMKMGMRLSNQKGLEFLTFDYPFSVDGKKLEQNYAAYFRLFKRWGWYVVRISSMHGVDQQIAQRKHTFYSQLSDYFESIDTLNGELVLLDRKHDTVIFPANMNATRLQSLQSVSRPMYGINKARNILVTDLPGVSPSDMYSATYPGLQLQVLFIIPRTKLIQTALNLILKQVLIILTLFLVSIMAISLILKRFTAPLVELKTFANELSNTDCILPSPSLRRLEELGKSPADEISSLAHSLLILQKALSERIQELIKASQENQVIAGALHQLNLELDLRVQQRTRQLEEANKELQTMEKNKTDFLSSVSHELRTPMTAIAGFVTMIQTRLEAKIFPALPQDSEITAHIARINRNLGIVNTECERLSSLIDTVLDIAKIESGNVQFRREKFDPLTAINYAVQTVSVLFEQEAVPLKLDLPSSLSPLVGDQDRIIQVLINLLANALKYSNNEPVHCRASQIGNNIMIQITDNGKGIPASHISTIFNKYIQLDSGPQFRIKGTGLGLSICKMIVEAHGGTIRVTSVSNKGSTFTVTLPTLPPLHGRINDSDTGIAPH